MTPDQIEFFAIRAALGNNGGTWAEHYTEKQKEHWRQFVRDLVSSALAQTAVDFKAAEKAFYDFAMKYDIRSIDELPEEALNQAVMAAIRAPRDTGQKPPD